jgi:hypothetical protein
MNLCRSCKLDFAGVDAFDKHRVGKHAFTYSEGLAMNPPREDGRRCLDADEMSGAGMELDNRERWALIKSETHREWFASLRKAA